MPLRKVPLVVTEEAARLIRLTHFDFGRFSTPPTYGRVRRRGTSASLGPYDFSQVRAQSEYLRVVTIVEAYVDTCSGALFDSKTQSMDAFYQKLSAAARDASTSSWPERKRAYADFHLISLGDCKKFEDIDAAIQVRNSIAHGLGRLTRKQNNTTKAKMRKIGIRFSGRNLLINRSAIDRLTESAVVFVYNLDEHLQR